MDLQISCGLHSEMWAQGAVSGTAPTSGRGVPKARPTEGIEGRGRASDGRPCPHAAVDSAEIRGVAGRRVYQGQERDPLGAGLRGAQAQLRGPALLGPWILREHGRPRRGGHPSLHSQSRETGSEARTNEPLALTTPPLGGSKLNGPRQRPVLPLRAVHVLKPPALPGDTYASRAQRSTLKVRQKKFDRGRSMAGVALP